MFENDKEEIQEQSDPWEPDSAWLKQVQEFKKSLPKNLEYMKKFI